MEPQTVLYISAQIYSTGMMNAEVDIIKTKEAEHDCQDWDI